MTQTRLHFVASNPRAGELFEAVEREFEDDGRALAMQESDEERDIHEISIYTSDPNRDAARVQSLFMTHERIAIGEEKLPDIDWVAKSLEGLTPVRAGRFLVHGSHDRALRRAADIAIEIDAGRAFGTGHHGTTAGCLKMIADLLKKERPRNALDLGTGSAVLAIALAKSAPIPILATDMDSVATGVASVNIRLNGVANRVNVATANGFRSREVDHAGPFDLIVANVLAGPLMKMATDMARQTASGGTLILSGFLVRQRRAVIAAFANRRFRHAKTCMVGEWATMQLKR